MTEEQIEVLIEYSDLFPSDVRKLFNDLLLEFSLDEELYKAYREKFKESEKENLQLSKTSQSLAKALDEACSWLVQAQSDDCYVVGCFKDCPYDCDSSCPTSDEWKEYFMKEVEQNGKD